MGQRRNSGAAEGKGSSSCVNCRHVECLILSRTSSLDRNFNLELREEEEEEAENES